MRRMKRHKRKNPSKRRHNGSSQHRYRRFRRNDETAAAPAKKPRKKPPTQAQRFAAQMEALVKAGLLSPDVAAKAVAAGPKPRAPKGEGKKKGEPRWKQEGYKTYNDWLDVQKQKSAARKAEAKTLSALKASIRSRIKAGEDVSAEDRALVARKAPTGPRKPRSRRMTRRKLTVGRRIIEAKRIIAGLEGKYRGPEERTLKSGKIQRVASSRAVAAKYMYMKDNSKATRKIAKAWREVQLAQKLASTPQERGQLRAMGLAGVPNPGMGVLKDLANIKWQIAGGTAGFLGAAVAGQMLFKYAVPEAKKEEMWAKAVPSAVALTLGGLGYFVLRKSKNKSVSSAAPFVAAGCVAAAALHAIVRVKVGDQTIAQKLGLPLGEYAAMAGYGEYAAMAGGFGEYAAMAGGTAYAGERGIFAGLDDTDPVLSGTDDEDEVDMVETLADEGVNADEGSLNGSIFD